MKIKFSKLFLLIIINLNIYSAFSQTEVYELSYNTQNFGVFKTATIYPIEYESTSSISQSSTEISNCSKLVMNFYASSQRLSNEASASLKCNLYPNPNCGNFIVFVESKVNGPGTIELFDLEGRILLSQTCNLTSGENNFPLTFRSVSGIYFVMITQVGDHTIQKFVLR